MGNPIIDRARAHYTAHGTQNIEVPEWGEKDKPLIVYWTPITLAERQKIMARMRENQTYDAMSYAIILKALDAKGEPLFTLDDKHALMHSVDGAVVDRLVSAIMASPTVEEMEKN